MQNTVIHDILGITNVCIDFCFEQLITRKLWIVTKVYNPKMAIVQICDAHENGKPCIILKMVRFIFFQK